MVVLNRRKLTVVERCRSNPLVNSIVDTSHLIRERKYVLEYGVSSLKSEFSNTNGRRREAAGRTGDGAGPLRNKFWLDSRRVLRTHTALYFCENG